MSSLPCSRSAVLSAFGVMAALLSASPVWAVPTTIEQTPELFGKLVGELVGLFVVATLMESAMALIFQWRLYREFFNGRAVKTVVMIAMGYAVVAQFDYDVFDRVVRIVRPGSVIGDIDDGGLSEFLSACVLAGGSAAVNELFKALGLRPPADPEQHKPKPPDDRAWVSVKVIRQDAVGDIRIHLVKVVPPDLELDKPATSELAGVVSGRKTFAERLRNVFLSDFERLPSYGGLTVETGQVYRIYAEAVPKSDLSALPVPVVREIYRGRFAGRAIVDLVYRF